MTRGCEPILEQHLNIERDTYPCATSQTQGLPTRAGLRFSMTARRGYLQAIWREHDEFCARGQWNGSHIVSGATAQRRRRNATRGVTCCTAPTWLLPTGCPALGAQRRRVLRFGRGDNGRVQSEPCGGFPR
jgi:hypothetical protein